MPGALSQFRLHNQQKVIEDPRSTYQYGISNSERADLPSAFPMLKSRLQRAASPLSWVCLQHMGWEGCFASTWGSHRAFL